MNKFKLIIFGAAFSSISYAQLPVTDGANLIMKALDYVEFVNEAATSLDNFKETTKIFEQGEEYYNALKNVHSIVKKSKNVEACIRLSSQTVSDYYSTYSKLSNDPNFSALQRNVYRKQQENIVSAIAKNVSGLNNIITNTGMSLSDKERLDAIDTFHARILSLHNQSRGLNYQMLGESESINKRKEQKRLERELLR